MINTYTNTRIEFHILQSFPVTCLNRDDVGAPKTAIVGGVPRARVSSQCWKRQVRLAMEGFGINLGSRTKLIEKYIAKACLAEGATQEQASNLGALVSAELSGNDEVSEEKGSTLLFLSDSEAKAFARTLKSFGFSFDTLDKEIALLEKEVKEAGKKGKKESENKDEGAFKKEELKRKKSLRSISGILSSGFDPAVDGLDIALFGRMVAKAADMNVEAAASFAHAISTHKVSNEVEFFTALDDLQTEPGSAHMGSLEFNSATYYRYVSLDLGQLAQVLGEDDLKKAIAAFTQALFVAVPNARQTTQSGASPWEFARVMVRKGQRLQVPFETAVKAKDGGFLQPSIDTLKTYLDKKEKLSGSLFGKVASYEWGDDEKYSIDDLIGALQNHVQ